MMLCKTCRFIVFAQLLRVTVYEMFAVNVSLRISMCAYRDALQIMPNPCTSSRLYSRLLHSIWYHRFHFHDCLQ